MSPKTQSGLLECMQERRVTVEGQTHELARPFVVLATQNPIEYEGTYPLPEAQLDRFMVRLRLGYPGRARGGRHAATCTARPIASRSSRPSPTRRRRGAQAAAAAIHGSEALRRYVVELCEATRNDSRVELGASPRAALMLFRAAKALAALEGATTSCPTTSRRLAPAVLEHRLVLAPDRHRGGSRVGRPRRRRARPGLLRSG